MSIYRIFDNDVYEMNKRIRELKDALEGEKKKTIMNAEIKKTQIVMMIEKYHQKLITHSRTILY